ncbi:MAG: hypothetical protein A2939_01390 [Parcubacteria group bacterium RIFCSPLOWO2_01_FULL_48_18]|nr:MAG: hypothetical protein A2939_01390 [Parcubacteria group bacterium RIFCSPLOWO2_01_FULL_48_18]
MREFTTPLKPKRNDGAVSQKLNTNNDVQSGYPMGFTLIEVILYVGIVVGMLGSSFVVMNNILIAQERNTINAEVFDNANFVMRKIVWALDDISIINQPSANTTSTTLSVNKASSTENPYVFDLASNTIRLSTGGGSATALTTGKVIVDSVSFRHVDPAFGPSSVQISIAISNAPQTGLTTYNASTTLETSIFLAN